MGPRSGAPHFAAATDLATFTTTSHRSNGQKGGLIDVNRRRRAPFVSVCPTTLQSQRNEDWKLVFCASLLHCTWLLSPREDPTTRMSGCAIGAPTKHTTHPSRPSPAIGIHVPFAAAPPFPQKRARRGLRCLGLSPRPDGCPPTERARSPPSRCVVTLVCVCTATRWPARTYARAVWVVEGAETCLDPWC